MNHPLLQHDIANQVLSYCVAPPCDDETLRSRSDRSHVPSGSAWLAKAARTCKAWLEPALRYLYRTLTLNLGYSPSDSIICRVPLDLLERVGPRVRTLVIDISTRLPDNRQNPFRHFTNLATLIVDPLHPSAEASSIASLLPYISSCPSLPNLVKVFIWSGERPVILEMLQACESLRQFGFHGLPLTDCRHHDDYHSQAIVPVGLEALVIVSGCHLDRPLAPLYAATGLVSLDISGWINDIDYRLIRQAIRASSHTLRTISVIGRCDPPAAELEGLRLAKAISSCLSVRFLKIGYPITSSTTVVHDIFELLAHLPIEFLALEGIFSDGLIDSLHLLHPNLLVLAIDGHNKDIARRIKSEFGHLVLEFCTAGMWPPLYHKLTPKARAVFKHRPYRAASLLLSRSSAIDLTFAP
jgi:hypothetical protein